MKKPFVTVILAGGKGTRMGSSDKHKVCFEVLGVPVIIRALETYNLCGSMLNVIVAGMMAEKVMATVNQRLPGTAYAFQEKPMGTGDAAAPAGQLVADHPLACAGIHLVRACRRRAGQRVALPEKTNERHDDQDNRAPHCAK